MVITRLDHTHTHTYNNKENWHWQALHTIHCGKKIVDAQREDGYIAPNKNNDTISNSLTEHLPPLIYNYKQ